MPTTEELITRSCRRNRDALTPTMLASLRVIRQLGKQDAALVCPTATIRALFRRGVIDSALTIVDDGQGGT